MRRLNRNLCIPTYDRLNKADAASSVRADGNGGGTFPAVAPGSYHLMISTRYNNQPLVWDQAVQLKAGQNSVTLDQRNAAPIQ
jgi:hypothetical protein